MSAPHLLSSPARPPGLAEVVAARSAALLGGCWEGDPNCVELEGRVVPESGIEVAVEVFEQAAEEAVLQACLAAWASGVKPA